ncbi:MAG: FkbM family methyltransferase [Chloracidobacterium sp.]|nr:FkbM family methyltransferase [Chloracidobacterium sp.]
MKMRWHKRVGRMLRQRLRNSILSKHGVSVLADTWNGLLLVEAGDFSVGRQLLKHGSYDKSQVEWLLECIGHQADTIVIVGAHIGSLLVPLSRASEKIIGFEPDTMNFRLLSRNLLLNEVHNAEVINAAVGKNQGMVAIIRNNLNTGNTSVSMDCDNACDQVEMVTLDNLLSSTSIDLMVMDIEGHEKHALEGGPKTIELTDRLYVEFAPEQLAEHGTNPVSLLQLLSRSFPLLYSLEDRVVCKRSDVGCREIEQNMGSRGFLKNLLFTKSELPNKAVNWTP